MAGICATLETYNDIRGLSKHIGDLALALVAPVCSNDCSYHVNPPKDSIRVWILWMFFTFLTQSISGVLTRMYVRDS